MADIYVRSTDGSNSDDGSTWALAKLDLAGAAAIDAAGDVINVSGAHANSNGGGILTRFRYINSLGGIALITRATAGVYFIRPH